MQFCAIAVHEGRTVQWRSEKSILAEIETISKLPDFKGIITDLRTDKANMYGFECSKKLAQGACKDKRCLYPKPCLMLKIDHQPSFSSGQSQKNSGNQKGFCRIRNSIRYDST